MLDMKHFNVPIVFNLHYARYYGVEGGGGWGGFGNGCLGQNEKGKRKKGGNCIKNGVKGLKIASFWVVNSKKNCPLNLYAGGKTNL